MHKQQLEVKVISTKGTKHQTEEYFFIHGTNSTGVRFLDIMKEFEKSGYRCHSVCLPGWGISESPKHRFTSNEELSKWYGKIISSIICDLGLSNVVVVGHSFGCIFTMHLGIELPDVIKQIVLVNPIGLFSTLGEYGWYWALVFKSGFPYRILASPLRPFFLAPLVLYGKWCRWNDISMFWLYLFSHREQIIGCNITASHITLGPFSAYWNTLYINQYCRLKIPVVFVYGANDTICPSHQGEFLARHTGPKQAVIRVKNNGHNPLVDPSLAFRILMQAVDLRTTEKNKEMLELSRAADKIKKTNYLTFPLLSLAKRSFHSYYSTLSSLSGLCVYPLFVKDVDPQEVQQTI